VCEDEHVNAILEDFLDNFFMSPSGDVFKSLDFLFDLFTIDGAIRRSGGIADDGEFSTAVDTEDRLHEMGEGMVVEVGGHVSDPQPRQAGRIS
jgi:hypothetical protein